MPLNCIAKALYDNNADFPDELPFKKDDSIIVLEQNIDGLQGWWLCSFKGRQGICPGNRLRLLSEDGCCNRKLNDVCDSYCSLPENRSISWRIQSNRMLTSEEKKAEVCVCKSDLNGDKNADYRYDVPPCGQPISVFVNSSHRKICEDPQTYHTVTSGATLVDRTDKCDIENGTSAAILHNAQTYDIPKPIRSTRPSSPAGSMSPLSFSICDSVLDPNRLSAIPDYDVPRSKPISALRIDSNSICYDVPLQIARELPLELHSAVENLEQLRTEITGAINTLLSHATPFWRETAKLEPKFKDIKLAILRLRSALHDLSEFGEGVLGNASNASDKGLVQKLRPLTNSLFKTNKIVHECIEFLENCGWSVDRLAKNSCSSNAVEDSKINCDVDSLDQLILCARSLTEDVRRFSSFVQGNATLLFKKNLMDSNVLKNGNLKDEDVDYINFHSRKTLNQSNSDARILFSCDMPKSFDLLITEAESGNAFAQLKHSIEINQNDKQVLSFYATQCTTHFLHLTHTIDAFLNSVERNQPPKVFLAHGKFVILSAHRLVHIGDTVHRNVSCVEINAQIARLSDALSEALAVTVREIKKAAVHFPSVVAVQDMVNSIVDVCHLARRLKMGLVVVSHTC